MLKDSTQIYTDRNTDAHRSLGRWERGVESENNFIKLIKNIERGKRLNVERYR